MLPVIRSHESELDVYDIAGYIAADNLPAACNLVDKIESAVLLLAEYPFAGVARPELGVNIRSFPVGPLLVFYRPRTDSIQVVRILHGSRELRKTLFASFPSPR